MSDVAALEKRATFEAAQADAARASVAGLEHHLSTLDAAREQAAGELETARRGADAAHERAVAAHAGLTDARAAHAAAVEAGEVLVAPTAAPVTYATAGGAAGSAADTTPTAKKGR